MSDPYKSARDHVALAAQNLPDAQAERLAWKHEAAMILDPATGTMRYADGSTDTAAWLRSVARDEPDLLAKPATETAELSPKVRALTGPQPFKHAKHFTVAPGTLSADMAAARIDPKAAAALMNRLILK